MSELTSEQRAESRRGLRCAVRVVTEYPDGQAVEDMHRWPRPLHEVIEIYRSGSQATPGDEWPDDRTMQRWRRGARMTYVFMEV